MVESCCTLQIQMRAMGRGWGDEANMFMLQLGACPRVSGMFVLVGFAMRGLMRMTR